MDKDQHVFSQISPARRSQLIEDQIKESISAGHYRVDERLPSERELAESFGTSRAVVREAIRGLEKAGLLSIKIGAQGGAFVTRIEKEPLLESIGNMMLTKQVSHAEIAQARLFIEPSMAAEAARKVTAAHLKQLKESLHVLNQGFLSNDAYIEHNPDPNLHKIIAEIGGNRLLIILMDVLVEITTKRFSRIKLDQKTQNHIAEEHESIVRAIEKRDPAAAAAAMKQHILSVYHTHEELEKRFTGKPRGE